MLDSGIFYPISGAATLHTTPGSGIWELVKDPDPRSGRLGLHKLSDKFEFDFKLYETGGSVAIKRVCDLWDNETFQGTNKNLGIVFNGTKGTGKTISAKQLCNEIGLPVIIVNHSYEGAVLDFIPRLSFEAIILIDEAEKTFSSEDDSHVLLKLIDGVYNKSRKLYILTTNRLVINDNLLGRPGRIRYIQEFGNLPKETVDQYIEDNLEDKTKRDEVMNAVDSLEISTIDILRSIIEEVNLFGDLGDTMLNIPRNAYTFDVVIFNNYSPEEIKDIREIIKKNKPSGESMEDWFKKNMSVGKDEDGDDITVKDLFDDNNRYCYVATLSTMSHDLYNGSSTNRGDIVSEVSNDGFVILRSNYCDEEVFPVLVLKKRKNTSLYNPYQYVL